MPATSSSSSSSLYAVLGIAKSATETDIARAYRRRALQCHPDRNPDGADAFKELSNAYAILSDPEKRARYDLTGIVPGSAQDTSNADDGRESMQERSLDIQEQLRVFFATYRNSAEECVDFTRGYARSGGDFRKMVREYLLFDNGLDGEVARLARLGVTLIRDGKLEENANWRRTVSVQGLRKVERDMLKERAEAEEALKEMGLDEDSQRRAKEAMTAADAEGSTPNLGALALLMRQRQQSSWQSMMSSLEAKYGDKGKRKSKRRDESASEEGRHARSECTGEPPHRKERKQ